jgi:hypothetical protein
MLTVLEEEEEEEEDVDYDYDNEDDEEVVDDDYDDNDGDEEECPVSARIHSTKHDYDTLVVAWCILSQDC